MESMITLCVVNWCKLSHTYTLCHVSAAWTVISRALAGKMLTFPFDALSEVFCSDLIAVTVWAGSDITQ